MGFTTAVETEVPCAGRDRGDRSGLSHQLEQVLALERLATNGDEDERVRRAAAEAVVEINGDAKVHGRYHEVIALRGVCWLEKTAVNETASAAAREAADDELRAVRQIDRPVERSRAVAAAIARVRKLALTPTSAATTAESGESGAEDDGMSADGVRGCVTTPADWSTSSRRPTGWWEINDAALVGQYATDEQWDAITRHRDQANAFLDTVADARCATTGASAPPRSDQWGLGTRTSMAHTVDGSAEKGRLAMSTDFPMRTIPRKAAPCRSPVSPERSSFSS